MDDLGERLYEIKFYECWEESIFLTEVELEEWYYEILELIADDTKTVHHKMQRLVAMITNE